MLYGIRIDLVILFVAVPLGARIGGLWHCSEPVHHHGHGTARGCPARRRRHRAHRRPGPAPPNQPTKRPLTDDYPGNPEATSRRGPPTRSGRRRREGAAGHAFIEADVAESGAGNIAGTSGKASEGERFMITSNGQVGALTVGAAARRPLAAIMPTACLEPG